ncbi:MAG: hypothetical protein CL923_11730 [Deltaproteobacteria bacterium]|nr:hypothetical protein [Deltaproteobacteria bacterium]
MMKEEQILFPLISRGDGYLAAAPIQVMEHEHDSCLAGPHFLRGHLTQVNNFPRSGIGLAPVQSRRR